MRVPQRILRAEASWVNLYVYRSTRDVHRDVSVLEPYFFLATLHSEILKKT